MPLHLSVSFFNYYLYLLPYNHTTPYLISFYGTSDLISWHPAPSTLHSSYSTPHLYILPLSAWLLANPTTLSFLWSPIEPPQWLTPNLFSRIWHTLHAALMMGFACSIEWHATDLINIHNAGRQAGASVQLKSAWTSPTRPELKSPNQTQSDRHRQMQTTTTAKISWITSIFYFYSYNIFFWFFDLDD